MKSEKTTGSVTLARIILATGIMVLFVISASFADVLQSEKECDAKAYKVYKSQGYDKKRCGSSTHFNAKLNACFIHLVCESNKGKKVSEYVENVSQGKKHALYVNSRPSTASGSCMVAGKQCKDYYEFLDLIKPYMED
jgi:hypothetical protein